MTPGKPNQPSSSRLPVFAAGAIIVAAAFAAYHNSFHGQFAFDDVPAIRDNLSIRHLGDLKAVLSPPPGGFTVGGRPLLNLSLAVDYAICGKRVWAYHATNLLIHLLACLVLFGILRRTLGRLFAEPATALSLAFATTLLWAVHPLQTEAVTYIIQRAESLMALFYLLTLYLFIRCAESDSNGILTGRSGRSGRSGSKTLAAGGNSYPSEHSHAGLLPDLPDLPVKKPAAQQATSPSLRPSCKNGWIFAVLSAACCLLGMATKEVMASAPVIVFLYDLTFVAGSFGEAWRKRRRYYIGLACTWGLLGWLWLNNSTRGRTVGFNAGIRPIDYWLTQFHAIAHYLRLVVWPRPLVIDYGTNVAHSLAEVWPYFLIVGVLAILSLCGIISMVCSRLSNAANSSEDESPGHFRWVNALSFCGFFFFSILAPTSLFPVVVQVMAEHRMYLALAPVLAVAVVGAYRFLEWTDLQPLRWLLPICVAAAVGLGFVTQRRNNDYRNELTLWGKTAAESPDNPRAVYNYGLALADTKDVPGAMAQYRRALALKPDYPEAHNNLGIALSQTGHWAEAMAEFRTAAGQDPTFGKAFFNIGYVYMHEHRLTDAINCFEEAEDLAPDYPEIYSNLGYALTKAGRPEEAIPAYDRAIGLKPDNAYAENNLGAVLDSLNRLPEAIAHYRAALRINSKLSKTHNDLGTALARTGHLDEATAEFELAVRLDPAFYLARLNLGHALMLSGRTQEAQAQYRQASLLPPTDSSSDYGPESISDPQRTP